MAAIDRDYYDRAMQRINTITGQVKQIFKEDQLAGLSDRFAPQGAPRGQ